MRTDCPARTFTANELKLIARFRRARNLAHLYPDQYKIVSVTLAAHDRLFLNWALDWRESKAHAWARIVEPYPGGVVIQAPDGSESRLVLPKPGTSGVSYAC